MKQLYKLFVACFLISGIAQAKLDATIPVIDMNDYYSKTRHHIFIQELSKAMQTVGFVAVINSKVDPKILDNAYNAAQNFYAKPLQEKIKCQKLELNGQRGYVKSEVAQGQAKKDYKEFYHISREYSEQIRAQYHYAANVWPEDQSFKLAIQQLIQELDQYTVVIESALSESMGEKPDFLTNMTRHGDVLLRAIHYPANPPTDSVWAAAHTDIDLFTILPRATAEGLQLKNSQGEWIDVIVPDNAFIINAGDMLQNLTNGVYKSAMHRVVSKNKNMERYSMVSFVHPRPDDKMDPLPKFISQVGSRKFANVTRNELLFERLIELGLHSPALLEQFAKSGAISRLIEVNRASPRAMAALRDANLATPDVLQELKAHES
jgi:isopenicillin N synthase-like dioxygenase